MLGTGEVGTKTTRFIVKDEQSEDAVYRKDEQSEDAVPISINQNKYLKRTPKKE